MVSRRCPGFTLSEILNIDRAADPRGIVVMRGGPEHAAVFEEGDERFFGAGFQNEGLHRSAL